VKKILVALLLILAGTVSAASNVESTKVSVAGGLTLATDIYHPAKEPAPTILIRTPYGRGGMDFLGTAFSEKGYAVAIQDVRGKYDSAGDHEPFVHERADGIDTLRWIAKQEWCDGNIGMWGQSYSGFASLSVADVELDAFKSIFSVSGWLDGGRVVKPGGAQHLMLNLPWMITQQGRVQRGLGEFDIDALFRHLPLRDALRAAGISSSAWEDPAWLESIEAREPLGEVPRPVFHVAGWYDMVYRATLAAWAEVSAAAPNAPQKLAIGPWFHDQMFMETFEVGDANFGEASGFGSDEMTALAVRWFDATLRGKKNGVLNEPPVQYFLMDRNTWHTAKEWPPAGKAVDEQRWYLDSAGAARGGGGALAVSKPSGSASDDFVFDPDNPVPTHGGANFHYFPERIGVRDQREIEKRQDVLVYTSAPLDKELQITGPISAELHIATSGKDTDFTAKLVVVRPDGYARIVEEGIARASQLLAEVPPPDTPFVLTIDLGQTAIAIPAGHRLRLEVSSSNFPKYDRNPNTGEDPFTATELQAARQTVFHTAQQASFLRLPVRRKPARVTGASTRPLVAPVEEAASAAVNVAGNDADALLARGRELLEQDEFDQAIAVLKRAVELQPDSSEHHLWLGRAYREKLDTASMFKKLGWSKKLRASYLRAVELDPDNIDARSSLASFYFNAPGIAGGSFDKGIAQALEVKQRDPLAGHTLLADAYAGKKDYAAAKREYHALIAIDPSDPTPRYRLGVVCQTEKSWDETFAAFEGAAAANGTDDGHEMYRLAALYQIGRTGVFSGEGLSDSAEALERYIASERKSEQLPSAASAHWRLGMIYQRMDKGDLARAQFERALELEPDHEQAREALEEIGTADKTH
jgi:putative CocE/NonD family hydrolase